MPIKNGFEASHEIREMEIRRHRENKRSLENNGGPRLPRQRSLIVALTSLASSHDQLEAVTCGIDMFLSKTCLF